MPHFGQISLTLAIDQVNRLQREQDRGGMTEPTWQCVPKDQLN